LPIVLIQDTIWSCIGWCETGCYSCSMGQSHALTACWRIHHIVDTNQLMASSSTIQKSWWPMTRYC